MRIEGIGRWDRRPRVKYLVDMGNGEAGGRRRGGMATVAG